MDNLCELNWKAVSQQLTDMDAMIRKQQIRIDGFIATLTALSNQVVALGDELRALRIMHIGHGPTAG